MAAYWCPIRNRLGYVTAGAAGAGAGSPLIRAEERSLLRPFLRDDCLRSGTMNLRSRRQCFLERHHQRSCEHKHRRRFNDDYQQMGRGHDGHAQQRLPPLTGSGPVTDYGINPYINSAAGTICARREVPPLKMACVCGHGRVANNRASANVWPTRLVLDCLGERVIFR